MFHYKDSLFFGRMKGGSVRVIQWRIPPKDWPQADCYWPQEDTEFDFIVDPDSWASIVASVSKDGEGNMRFYIAKAFHND